jgi:hypothetical protein
MPYFPENALESSALVELAAVVYIVIAPSCLAAANVFSQSTSQAGLAGLVASGAFVTGAAVGAATRGGTGVGVLAVPQAVTSRARIVRRTVKKRFLSFIVFLPYQIL